MVAQVTDQIVDGTKGIRQLLHVVVEQQVVRHLLGVVVGRLAPRVLLFVGGAIKRHQLALVAKRVPLLSEMRSSEPMAILPAMARSVSDMVRGALDAYAARDAAGAVAVQEADRHVDDFYNSLFRTLLTYMMENPASITESAHLLFIAKNLERIGDHATNIAEIVHYEITGAEMAGGRPKTDALQA